MAALDNTPQPNPDIDTADIPGCRYYNDDFFSKVGAMDQHASALLVSSSYSIDQHASDLLVRSYSIDRHPVLCLLALTPLRTMPVLCSAAVGNSCCRGEQTRCTFLS
jgi:hypothetical protein